MTAAHRDEILAEVEVAHRRAIDAGMVILRRWAATGEPFSANDVRAELRAAGVEAKTTGALFAVSVTAGVLVPIGFERSTDPGTHAKPVARYLGARAARHLEVVSVPVVRNPDGRFTTHPGNEASPPPALDTPPLFDL